MTDPVAAVRHFSRFYTRQLGLLDEGLLRSDFSLTEARILYELANFAGLTATDLCRELGLDPGYLSRILKGFDHRGLLAREPSPSDGRQTLLSLTPAGQAAFAPLDEASKQQVSALLERLGTAGAAQLVRSMQSIERLLVPSDPAYRLRPPRVGDIGWVIRRQAMLYNEEFGWDATFEILLARIFAEIMENFDPSREAGWIAERGGDAVGSVYLVRQSDDVAKLRLLYVEPSARGLGIGRRLVRECIAFARERAYRTITLWTNDPLVAARRIYVDAGFKLVAAEPVRAFGKDMVSETWELPL